MKKGGNFPIHIKNSEMSCPLDTKLSQIISDIMVYKYEIYLIYTE